MFRIALPLLILCTLAYAQLDSNSVTVTVARPGAPQPDEVMIGVTVNTGIDKDLTDVVSLLRGSGVTMAHFTGVGAPATAAISVLDPGIVFPAIRLGNIAVQWNFTVPAPIARMKDVLAQLSKYQQDALKTIGSVGVTYSVTGSQLSQAAQLAWSCPVSELLTDARVKAQKLADGAGMNLGVVLAMANTPASVLSGVTLPCTLTVKFAASRY
jgi:hypothetical protein